MLIFLAGFFRTIKKRSFTRHYSKRSNILWPTPIKSSVKIPLVVFGRPYRGDQQLFVL
ncbi:hypothetical protein AB08_2401 [Escherichia coli 5-366-08_S1_C1]|nr:hypothetical protein AB67_3618 [Escherichia coli 5-366-08_S1_C3]KEL69514.1 hypothetical protein AB08_2401 [Escherichia coli 5-366-08_S1_C1]